MNFYDNIDHIAAMYELLQDDLSRNIFWARLQFDLTPTMSGAIQLLQWSEGYTEDEVIALKTWKETFRKLHDAQKQIFLYGAGSLGRLAADLILKEGEDFFAFCDRRASELAGTPDVLGRPVYPPNYLFENANQCYVIIATTDYYTEIEQFLLQNAFPQDHILPLHFERYIDCSSAMHGKQYFAFPDLYRKGTAFVDAGCFDGETSIQFAEWCGNQYEGILAFEPDSRNFRICKERMEKAGLRHFDVIQAVLSAGRGAVRFVGGLDEVSYIPDASRQGSMLVEHARGTGSMELIQAVKLDDYTEGLTVGFIKMDIEGAEMEALQGARDTIRRDKPLMALSAYHRRGDVLAIMSYLHQIVPEYRFWIRHYGPLAYDSVLYAGV